MSTSIDVPITTHLTGQDQVTAGFRQMGQAADQTREKINANTRALMTGTASFIGYSTSLMSLFSRMQQGNISAGEAILQLTSYSLQFGAQLMMLNTLYEKRLSLQAASALASARESASNAVATASVWAKTAALKAETIAHGIKNALSGPTGWAILAGATVAAAGVMSLAANIPKMAQGGVVNSPTLALIGERGPEAVVPLNSSGFGATTINVIVNGAGNYEEARRGAFDGVNEALLMNSLRRKERA